jgi:hypothetical protein
MIGIPAPKNSSVTGERNWGKKLAPQAAAKYLRKQEKTESIRNFLHLLFVVFVCTVRGRFPVFSTPILKVIPQLVDILVTFMCVR